MQQVQALLPGTVRGPPRATIPRSLPQKADREASKVGENPPLLPSLFDRLGFCSLLTMTVLKSSPLRVERTCYLIRDAAGLC